MAPPYDVPLGRLFLHVAYEHRHFAACAAASQRWAVVLPGRYDAPANEYLADAWVTVRTAFLAHARNLTEFYCHPRRTTDGIPRRSDLNLHISDFGITSPDVDLDQYFDSISVHVDHITAWRDADFRRIHEHTRFQDGKPGSEWGRTRQRVDWDAHAGTIVDAVNAALAHAATPASAFESTDWWRAFAALHRACERRCRVPTSRWPSTLDRRRLARYLDWLGLG